MQNNRNRKLDELKRDLTAQITAYQRSGKITLITTCILLPVMVAYLSWICINVREIIRPEAIAELARGRAQAEIPRLAADLSASLKAQAPEAAREVWQRCIDKLPDLRESTEALVDEALEQIMEGAEEEIDRIMSELVATGTRDMYVQVIDTLSNEEAARRVAHDLIQGLLDDLGKALHKEMGLGLDRVLEVSLATLQPIYVRLDSLRSKQEHELTEAEDLQKEFVMVVMEALRKFSRR